MPIVIVGTGLDTISVQDSDAADFARCRRLDARFIVGSFSFASTNGGKVIRLVARSTYFAFGWAVFILSVRFAAVSAIPVWLELPLLLCFAVGLFIDTVDGCW